MSDCSSDHAKPAPKKKSNIITCCVRKTKPKPKPKPVQKPEPPLKQVVCDPIVKPPKKTKPRAEPKCDRFEFYKSGDEQRAYLSREVVPILMEGMLGLAREQPQDPITYLYKFWNDDQHKCDIPLVDNLL